MQLERDVANLLRAFVHQLDAVTAIRILACIPILILPPVASLGIAAIVTRRLDLSMVERRHLGQSALIAVVNLAFSLLVLTTLAGHLFDLATSLFGSGLGRLFPSGESAPPDLI